MKTLFSLIALSTPFILLGKNLDDDIGKFFDKFNTSVHTNSPDYINSQMGVHFLGGTGTVRTGVYDVNPIHINFPNISAGCGGIDYTLGGINIASKDQMKSALKSIASNGVGYAFLLGIETMSPVIASTMKQIQTWANQLNAININSCDFATNLVQGAWPKSQRASSYICEHASTSSTKFTDLIEAKHGCRDDQDKRKHTLDQVKVQNKHILVGNYNIAWKALDNLDFDEETKNLFMNITGTIVSRETTISIFPPNHKKGIDLLRHGGTLEKAYKIAEDKISIKNERLEIKPESSWKSKVSGILRSLQRKLLLERNKNKVTLSEEEEKNIKNLLQTTNFPIGSLLSLMTQYNGEGAGIAIDRYSDLIAFDRVLKFAEEVIHDTLNQAEALRAAQIDGYELDEYIKQVSLVLKDLQAMSLENLQSISAEHQVINYLIKIDKTLRDKERGV